MKTLLTLFLYFILIGISHATTYTVCASGCDFANVAAVNAASLSSGDIVQFKRGETFTDTRINLVSGVTYTATSGAGADPIFDLTKAQTGWTSYGSNIYYSAVGENNISDRPYVLLQDGTKLRFIPWDTDIATTAPKITPGTFSVDQPNAIIYVQTTDSADPTAKTMKRANFQTYFYGTDKTNITISEIEIRYANQRGIYCAYSCSDITVQGCTFTQEGWSGAYITGDNAVVVDNSVYDSGVSLTESNKTESGIHVRNSDYAQIYRNTVDHQTGSAYEVATCDHVEFYNNTGTDVYNQGIEFWGDYGNIYNNYFTQGTTTYLTASTYPSCGILVTHDSDENDIYNNVAVNFDRGGLGLGTTLTGYGNNSNNNFFNNTLISNKSYKFGAIYNYTSVGEPNANNVFKNNIVYGYGTMIYENPDSSNTYNYNIYYPISGTVFANIAGTTYANFTLWKAAESQDANSLNQDPLIDGSLYTLNSGSPAIGAALLSQCPLTDKDGYARSGSICDMGAYAIHRGSSDGNRFTLKRITIK